MLRGAVSANKDSGKCSVTSADLKMRATLSTRAGYDPTHSAVTHKDEGNKYHGTAGIVIKVEGTKKGRTITVRWADGVERPYTTKQLEVVGSKVNTDWDLRSIVSEGTITTSALKIKLMVYIGGIPYSLVGAGSGKYEAAPFVREEEGAPSFFEERKKRKTKEVPISKDALHFDTAELLRSIDKGEVKWFYPEAYRAAEGSSKRDGPTETPSIGWNPAVSDSESDDESTSSLDDMIADNYEDPSTRPRPCENAFGLSAKTLRNSGNCAAIHRDIIARPRTHKGRRVSGKVHSGTGWKIPKRGDPIADNTKVKFNVDWYRQSDCIGVMDFLSEYPEFTPDIDRIRCPVCGECGNVSGKGYTFSSGVTTCYDIQSSFPCTMHRYRCVGCPEAVKVGKKESDFTAMDIADQFDPILRERLPVVVGDAMMTTSLLDVIISLALNGNSLAMIHRHVSEIYHSYDTRNHLSYLRHAEYHYFRTAPGLIERSGGFQPEAYAGVRGGGTCKPPSMAFLRRAIVEDRRRDIVTELRYITSLVGKVMCSDHTFWACKHVREEAPLWVQI